ncbi:transglutaminase domain-containing protein [Micromonospora aurantiaca (nom. illeg.)]|uniref:transglutaminase domain-containing protein n=1 Tax=Micromonospora aurantiaca (nom. illeg.) TaxID=47850 RepID=UPI0001DF6FA7|nr:transglutaminase domain-containing protein [Micromonospora aurantiaca]ADL47672.1 transglutaminase domain-containing protein [Micromonospora aurantiaca ATCC 27029]
MVTPPRTGAAAERAVRALRAAPVPAALIVLVALCGVVLGRVYADPLLTRLMAGAAAGSVLVSVAARRLPSWLVAPLSVAALTGWTLLSLRLAAAHAALPGGLGEVAADAARNAIPRLLTAMIPVEPAPDTVLVPVVAAWLAGLTAAEVALRTGRVLLGYLPPALLYAGALYVVGPNADPAIGPTVLFAAVAAAGLATPARRDGPAPDPVAGLTPAVRAAVRLRLVAASAAGLAVVVALAALLAPVVAAQVDERPVDPRRYVEPPRVESLDENPLIRISGWALNPDQRLLDVRTVAGAGDGGSPRIRLAVLSDYDGVTWRVGATYRNAGRILPAAEPAPDAATDEVRQEITVGDLTGRLLPAVPTPREVTGARVAYDPATGTLIRPEGLAPGLRYEVSSVRERPDANLLPTANVPAGDEVARVLRVADGAPEPVRRLATQLAESNGAPYARADAIATFLAEHYRVTADAPSGHAYPNLAFFLFGPRNGGGQRGTSEQFAAAFAVLGRLAGLPTRVVVGFEPKGDGPVRAADAYAWPEVLFDGVGWVPFDPMPRPDEEPRPVEEDFRPQPEDPPPSEVPAPTEEPSVTPPAAAPAPGRADGGLGTPVLVAGGVGGLALLVGTVLAALYAARRRLTRSRLDAADPGERVAGAWRELTDALRLAGHPAGPDLAAAEVAERARRTLAEARAARSGDGAAGPTDRPGDGAAGPTDRAGEGAAAGGPDEAAVDDLAALLNQAGFAPGSVTPEQAERAARLSQGFGDALRSARSRWGRLLWTVHPGPLRWRR